MSSFSNGLDSLLACTAGDEGRMLLLIRGLFPAAAGPVAEKLHPHSFCKGELLVSAADERWVTAGRENAEELRRRLNRLLGREVVERIRIATGGFSAHEQVEVPLNKGGKRMALPPAIAESAGIIRDERAREAFLELAACVAALRDRE
jgi:hypothetical protein